MNKFSNLGLAIMFASLIYLSIACSQPEQIATDNKTSQPIKNETIEKKYLYYLHGRIIEDMGAENAVSEKFGKYEYQQILKTFKDAGFEVVSETRPKDTDVKEYSTRLTNKIKEKIKIGISPKNITVVGASKGALITMLTSTKLVNKDIKFVLMGNCNKWVQENFDINLHGKILSIYEKTDTIGGNSCEEIKAVSKGVTDYKEIQINTGLDHGYLYKPLDEWVKPAIDWAKS